MKLVKVQPDKAANGWGGGHGPIPVLRAAAAYTGGNSGKRFGRARSASSTSAAPMVGGGTAI